MNLLLAILVLLGAGLSVVAAIWGMLLLGHIIKPDPRPRRRGFWP